MWFFDLCENPWKCAADASADGVHPSRQTFPLSERDLPQYAPARFLAPRLRRDVLTHHEVLGVLSELWHAKPRHGPDVHEVQLQPEGRSGTEVQRHDADVEQPSCAWRSWSGTCVAARIGCARDAAASRWSAAEQAEGHDGRRRTADAWLSEDAAAA
jgi:hypothetical protein